MGSPGLFALTYSNLPHRVPPVRLYRIAWFCAAAPLGLGLLALLGLWLTGNTFYAMVGTWVMIVGAVAVTCGVVLDFVYLGHAHHATESRQSYVRRGRVVLCVLLANIPIAWLGYLAGVRILDVGTATVIVYNESGWKIYGGALVNDQARYGLRVIPNDSRQQIRVPLVGGPLELTVDWGTTCRQYLLLNQLGKSTLKEGEILRVVVTNDGATVSRE